MAAAPAGRDRLRRRGRRRGRAGGAARRARPAGRCWPTRPPACAAAGTTSPRDRPLRRAAARRGLRRRARARPGAAHRRHAHLEAAARLARRRRSRWCSTRSVLARADPGGRTRCWPPTRPPACDALAAALEIAAPAPTPAGCAAWRAADALVPPALAAAPDPFEPKVYAALAETLPDGATSGSARRCRSATSSRSSRVADKPSASCRTAAPTASTARSRPRPAPRWRPGAPDLPADRRAGAAARRRRAAGRAARAGAELSVVCVNNGGGGIFDFLPVPGHADAADYEEHVATPTGIDLGARGARRPGAPVATTRRGCGGTPGHARGGAHRPGGRACALHRALYRSRVAPSRAG